MSLNVWHLRCYFRLRGSNEGSDTRGLYDDRADSGGIRGVRASPPFIVALPSRFHSSNRLPQSNAGPERYVGHVRHARQQPVRRRGR